MDETTPVKVSELSAITTLDNADLFLVSDVSANQSKKLTFEDLINNIIGSDGIYTKTETDALLALKENLSNKVTSISSSSTDTQYPSAKCVYTIVGDINSALDAINGETI